MFSISDSCLLCHTSCKNCQNILSQDTDGVVIEEKLKFFLFEVVQAKLAISKQICMKCLNKLNFVYQFKHMCLRNIIKFNNSLHLFGNDEQPNKNMEITLTSQNIPETTQVRNGIVNHNNTKTKVSKNRQRNQKDDFKRQEDYKAVTNLISAEKKTADEIYGLNFELGDEIMDVKCELNIAEEIVVESTKHVYEGSNIKPKSAEINSKIHFLPVILKNRAARSSGNLVQRHHKKKLFLDRPFHCKLCPCKFINNAGLNRHVQLIHSD